VVHPVKCSSHLVSSPFTVQKLVAVTYTMHAHVYRRCQKMGTLGCAPSWLERGSPPRNIPVPTSYHAEFPTLVALGQSYDGRLLVQLALHHSLVSEINDEFGRNSQIFPPSVDLTSTLQFLEYCSDGGAQKSRTIPLSENQNKFDIMCIRLDTRPQRAGQTDGRTDRQKW